MIFHNPTITLTLMGQQVNIPVEEIRNQIKTSAYKLVPKTEEELQTERINNWLEKNQLKVGDLKKIMTIALSEDEKKEAK